MLGKAKWIWAFTNWIFSEDAHHSSFSSWRDTKRGHRGLRGPQSPFHQCLVFLQSSSSRREHHPASELLNRHSWSVLTHCPAHITNWHLNTFYAAMWTALPPPSSPCSRPFPPVWKKSCKVGSHYSLFTWYQFPSIQLGYIYAHFNKPTSAVPNTCWEYSFSDLHRLCSLNQTEKASSPNASLESW